MKNTKKRILAMLSAAVMCTALTACGGTSGSTADSTSGSAAAASGDEFVIGCEYSASSSTYCMNFANCVKQYGEEAGMKVILTQGNRDVYTQISNAESMAAQGCQVIGGIWDDSDAALPVATTCKESDVWCVGLLNGLADRGNGYEKYAFVGSQNYDGGYIQGTWLAENLPKDTEIFFLASQDGDQQCLDREKGMLAALADLGRDDVTVAARENAENNRDQGLKIMENWLQAYDNIKCVVAVADEVALPAIEAMKSAGRFDDDVIVAGFDGSAEACESIMAGEMSMSVLQDYKAQAKAYVELCEEIRDGKTPEDKFVPFLAIDSSNAEEYKDY